jgi:hypothetical protein
VEWLKRTMDRIDEAHHILVNVMGPKRRRMAGGVPQRA